MALPFTFTDKIFRNFLSTAFVEIEQLYFREKSL